MNILKKSKNLFKLQPFFYRFSTSGILGTQLGINGHKNAVRFESQNLLFTYGEFNTHSNAVAYGLVELGWQPGDKLLLWVEKAQSAEVITAIIGAAKAGIQVIPCLAESSDQLASSLKDCNGIIFSPNSSCGSQKYVDVVNSVLPELGQLQHGQEFKSSSYPNLKNIIHTGPYTFPGTLKYRQFLVYASKNFNTLSLPDVDESRPLLGGKSLSEIKGEVESWRNSNGVDKQTILVSGDAKSVNGISGILNSLLFGNYTVYTGNQDIETVKNIGELHDDAVVLLDGEVSQDTSGFAGKKVHVFDRKAN